MAAWSDPPPVANIVQRPQLWACLFPCVGGPVGVAYAVREALAGPSGGRRKGNDVKPSGSTLCMKTRAGAADVFRVGAHLVSVKAI